MSEDSLTSRPRAKRMPPSERRRSIVVVAVPLLAAKGDSITVSEVAQAAGVAEATVFKVFPTRHSLIQTCLETVMETGELETALVESRSDEASMKDQLEEIAESLAAYLKRALPVHQAVGPASREDSMAGTFRILMIIESLITEEFDSRFGWHAGLKSRDIFTKAFTGTFFAAAMQSLAGLQPPAASDLVNTLLHGSLDRTIEQEKACCQE